MSRYIEIRGCNKCPYRTRDINRVWRNNRGFVCGYGHDRFDITENFHLGTIHPDCKLPALEVGYENFIANKSW